VGAQDHQVDAPTRSQANDLGGRIADLHHPRHPQASLPERRGGTGDDPVRPPAQARVEGAELGWGHARNPLDHVEHRHAPGGKRRHHPEVACGLRADVDGGQDMGEHAVP
jgi:hypothetical protein